MVFESVLSEFKARGGNLWETGKRLSITGGEVRRILVAGGVEVRTVEWSKDELTFVHRATSMQSMIGSEIAEELGRNPAVVLAKCNELFDRPLPQIVKLKKVPYGSGYTKRNAAIRIRELANLPGLCVLHYAKINHLDPRLLVQSFKAFYPERLESIKSNLENVTFTVCPYCNVEFANRKRGGASFCSDACNRKSKTDLRYFGGKRRLTLGVPNSTCQVCGAKHSALQVHHIVRKGNDQENEHMIGLCPGCHSVVSKLALHKKLTTNKAAIQALVALALAEMDGASLGGCVDEERMRWFPLSGQERTKLPCEVALDLSDPLLGEI